MTCVLTSAWEPFTTHSPWSPMNSDFIPTSSGLERQPSHGYMSSGSESRKPASSSGKKRASRAGTRSVTTLSTAQLERKRANDREAQRAIRQRTKDHIEVLEKTVSELRGSQESNDKIVAVTQQRNRELEEENLYLRNRLNEAGYPADVSPAETHRQPDPALLSVHSTSPATQASASGSSVQRPTSTPRSLSVTTPSQSSSRHGSFQQQGSYVPSAPTSAVPVPNHDSLANQMSLTTWRSHDGTTSVHPAAQSVTPHVQEPMQSQTAPVYQPINPPERADWPAQAQHYQYPMQPEQQPQQQYDVQQPQHPPPPALQQQQYVQQPAQAYAPAPPPLPPPQQQHVQTPVQAYAPAQPTPTAPQQQPYQPPQMPPQTEFQNMAVSSPSAYQVQQQQSYQQPSQQQAYQPTSQPQAYQQPTPMQMSPVQVQAAAGQYTPTQGQMQPPPVPATAYQPAATEQQYAPPHMHPPMQYRDDSSNRQYALTHYPSG